MAAQELALQVGVAPACQALGVSRATFSTVVRGRLPGTSSPVQRPPGHCVSLSASRFSMYSPQRASLTARPQRWWRRCSMTSDTCAPSAPCTGYWLRVRPCESGAINASILNTPSPSWWPRGPINAGRGTSRSYWGRRSGPTTTSTSCSTSSAATWWAGWWPTERTRPWLVA